MLMSYVVNGPLAQAGQPSGPTAMDYYRKLIGLQGLRAAGELGAFAQTQFDAFVNGQQPTYNDGLVACKRDSANSPYCFFTAAPSRAALAQSSVADMQRATDAIFNKIPVFHQEGLILKGAPQPDGSRIDMPAPFEVQNPIVAKSSGYDGIVGSRTGGYILTAITVAGSLKALPDEVALAFMGGNEALMAQNSPAIAAYLNDVAANFDSLLADFKRRTAKVVGPVSPALRPKEEIAIIKRSVTAPVAKRKFPTAAVAATAVVTAGLVGLGAWGATRTKLPVAG